MTDLQTQEYILHRLKIAGSQSRIFTDDTIEAIVNVTLGTPRLVNTLCDRALHVSYELKKTVVDLDSVRRAADDIGLGSKVFLWLTNRDKVKAWQAERQATAFAVNPNAMSGSGKMDSAPVDRSKPLGTHQNISQRSVFTIRNKLFDKSIAGEWISPLLQLFFSILMFTASLWFFVVNVRM